MKTGNRQLIHAAVWLRDEYVSRAEEERARVPSGFEVAVRPCVEQTIRTEHLLEKACARSFAGAARRLTQRYVRAQEDLLSAVEWHLKQAKQEIPQPPTVRALVEELLACQDEFGAVEICRAEDRVSIQSEPIVLDGVPLGRFRIDLAPGEIPSGSPLEWFRVKALDPNPSAPNENVPHPHVDGDHLCTGDGSTTVHAALIAGRLNDFFVLIRSILQTYNPDSPYVALEDWDGRPCCDCGYTTNEEGAYYCEGCEETYCDECIRSCENCGTTLCRECLRRSEISEVWVCENCAGQCDDCSRWCTTEELTDGLCEHCQETQDHKETSHETDPTETTIGTPHSRPAATANP